MDIKEFVSETLVQICEGIVDAQKRARETGAIISPRMLGSGEIATPDLPATAADIINFDIAVEARESNTKNEASGIKASLAVLGVKAGVDTTGKDCRSDTSASVSRISFAVRVRWPVQELTPEQRQKIYGVPDRPSSKQNHMRDRNFWD